MVDSSSLDSVPPANVASRVAARPRAGGNQERQTTLLGFLVDTGLDVVIEELRAEHPDRRR